jgi:hypothetical protein
LAAAPATTRFWSTAEHARHCEPAAPLAAGASENSVAALQGTQLTGPESWKEFCAAT